MAKFLRGIFSDFIPGRKKRARSTYLSVKAGRTIWRKI
jgi:hypothetical protein